MEMRHEAIDAQLAMLLRDQARSTTANLTDFAVAYWDGQRVVYVFLDEQDHVALDEEFDLTDYLLDQWEADFATWFAAPHYSVRPELLKWLKVNAYGTAIETVLEGGPMKTTELSDATLDLWVERAEMLRLNPDTTVAELDGVAHCQRFTADPDLARLIIEREGIVVEQIQDPYRGTLFLAHRPGTLLVSPFVDDGMSHGDTYVDAAMLCYVTSVFGREAEFKMLWDDGAQRYEPFE